MTSNYNHCTKEVKYIISRLIINLKNLSINRENTELNLLDVTDEDMNSPEKNLELTKKVYNSINLYLHQGKMHFKLRRT